MAAVKVAEHLAKLLAGYEKPLYVLLARGADSWDLLIRPPLLSSGADFAAIKDDDGGVWVFSDCAALKEWPDKARALPTAAPGMILKLAAAFGDSFELSEGWTSAVACLAQAAESAAATATQPGRPRPGYPWCVGRN
jgi:hypothetical protein